MSRRESLRDCHFFLQRIMDIAEQAAMAQKEDDIDLNYQFVSAKNLTNSAPNYTDPDVQEVSAAAV